MGLIRILKSTLVGGMMTEGTRSAKDRRLSIQLLPNSRVWSDLLNDRVLSKISGLTGSSADDQTRLSGIRSASVCTRTSGQQRDRGCTVHHGGTCRIPAILFVEVVLEWLARIAVQTENGQLKVPNSIAISAFNTSRMPSMSAE